MIQRRTLTIPLILVSLLAFVCASGCVRPTSPSWRIANNLLIPPGVTEAAVTRGTAKADVGRRAACPLEIRARRKEVIVTVTRDSLSKQPPGWLATWTDRSR